MNTTRYKQSFVGLLLLSLVGMEVFAETRVSSLSGYHHSGQLTLDAAYGDKQNSHGTVDLLYPLYERSDAIGFVDVRGMSREGPVSEFNLGGGYRWLNESQSQLYGVYGFYDAKQSAHSNNYTQLTLGGEWKMAEYSLGGNVYVPMGSQKNEVSRSPIGAELSANPAQSGTFVINLTDDVLYEYAYQGLDVEAGYQVPQLPGLTTYVGAYHFTHKDSDAITGPRLSVEYDVLQHIKQVPSWLGSVDVVASVQHDAVRETLWSVGVQVSIPLGSQASARKSTGLKKALTSVVRRDIDIVTSTSAVNETYLYTKDDGSSHVLKPAATKEALLGIITNVTGSASSANIVAVTGNVTVDGDTTAGGAEGLLTTTVVTKDTEAAIVLPDDLILIGGDMLIVLDGREYTLPISTALACNSKCSITLAQENAQGAFVQTGHLIRVGQNNTLQNITLIVPPGGTEAGSKGQQSAAITNTMGIIETNANLTDEKIAYDENGSHFVPFGNLTLTNVDVTGGGMVYFNVDGDATTESTVTITGGNYNITNPYVGRSYATGDNKPRDDVNTSFGAITLIDQGDGTKLGKHKLSDMTLSTAQALPGDSYTYRDANGDDVTANEIPAISGIAVSYLSESGSLTNNTITGVSATGSGINAVGIVVMGDMDNGSQIGGNQFTGSIEINSGDGSYVMGIGIYGSVDGVIGCKADETVCANTFTGAITSAQWVYGIYAVDVLENGVIGGNEFNGIKGEWYTGGVFVAVSDDKTMQGKIINNQFNVSSGETYTIFSENYFAVGIDVSGDMSGANSKISGNQFSGSIETKSEDDNHSATGIFVSGSVDGVIGCKAGETACANIFTGAITSAKNAYGIYAADVLENGVIGGNTFNGLKGELYTGGVYVAVTGDKTMQGKIISNVFNISSGETYAILSENNYALGIEVGGDMSGDNSKISGNQFSGSIETKSEDGNHSVAGISVSGSVNGVIGCKADETVCANTFTGAITSAKNAFGIYAADVLENGVIGGNEFNGIHGDKRVRGVYVAVSDDKTMQGKIINNVFNISSGETYAILSENDYALGIEVVGDMSGANSQISGNQFSGSIETKSEDGNHSVAGISVSGSVDGVIGCKAGETACANIFTGAITSAKNAYGIYAADVLENGVIGGNTFNGLKGELYTGGVYVAVTGDKTMQGKIISNVFNISSGETYAILSENNYALGIEVGGDMSGDNSQISGNKFSGSIKTTGTGANHDARGIQVTGSVASVIGCADGAPVTELCANVFNSITSEKRTWGLLIQGDFTGQINGNTFNVTAATAGQYAYGIYFDNHIGTAAGNITNNTLNVTAATPANAIGISLAKDDSANQTALRDNQNNTFGTITADEKQVEIRG